MDKFRMGAGLILGCWGFAGTILADPLPVVSVTTPPNRVVLQMQTGTLQLQFCGERTIHVIYSPEGKIPDGPTGLAVLKEPAPGPFQETETPDAITVKTAQCGVQVDKKTGALVFLGKDGAPFLREAPDGGKTLAPSQTAGIATHSIDQKFMLDPTEALYGLGQRPSGVMNYVGSTVHLEQVNGDVAIPVLLSSKGYGVFWNNPAITDVIISKASDPHPTVEWKSEFGSVIDYYVFYGPTTDEVIADYRELTGAAPMFGRWAWGFWQCKEHYATQQELLDVVARYREMKIPLDCIIQDWFYWNPYPWGSHMFDAARYPDPSELTQKLHAESAHIIISVWAKFDPGSPNFEALRQAGDLLEPPASQHASAIRYYDPFKPEARKLYWEQISQELFAHGFDGWWLDASEPELNVKWGEFRELPTNAGPGAAVYNAYPLMHTTAVYQGQRAENSDKRVFILTRSAYAGQQRNAAVTWSGDIQGTWDVYAKQIPDGINFTYSGIPYWNTDIGGFFGHDPADPAYAELFTRWFQFGSFCPMFRVHGTNQPKEMWRFAPEIQAILIKFDKLRYHLLPYIYSTAWKVTNENSSMMRGLVMDFQHDPKVYNIPDQYMFGPALLVNPVTKPLVADKSIPSTRDVYLPADTSWTDFWTGENAAGGQTVKANAPIETMPLYVRAGSIIPYGPDVQYAAEKVDPIELRVYRGADGAFTLYEDENDNYNYEKGAYATISFSWSEKDQALTIGKRLGKFPGMLEARTIRIVWVSPGHGAGVDLTAAPDVEVRYTGNPVTVPFVRK
jgi:alpha-D-xyloside xylohydrolase